MDPFEKALSENRLTPEIEALLLSLGGASVATSNIPRYVDLSNFVDGAFLFVPIPQPHFYRGGVIPEPSEIHTDVSWGIQCDVELLYGPMNMCFPVAANHHKETGYSYCVGWALKSNHWYAHGASFDEINQVLYEPVLKSQADLYVMLKGTYS